MAIKENFSIIVATMLCACLFLGLLILFQYLSYQAGLKAQVSAWHITETENGIILTPKTKQQGEQQMKKKNQSNLPLAPTKKGEKG